MNQITKITPLLLALCLCSCFDSSVEIITADSSVRIKELEGNFHVFPDLDGGGWYNFTDAKVFLQWDEKQNSLYFDQDPKPSDYPKGLRASDAVFKYLRMAPVDQDRGVYLVQMIDHAFSVETAEIYKIYKIYSTSTDAEMAKAEKAEKAKAELDKIQKRNTNLYTWIFKHGSISSSPRHPIFLIRIDPHGGVWYGDESAWFSSIQGLSEAFKSGNGQVALNLLRKNMGCLPMNMFTEKLLSPVK